MLVPLRFGAPWSSVICSLSLHDALPISRARDVDPESRPDATRPAGHHVDDVSQEDCLFDVVGDVIYVMTSRPDRKSTRLNSSHITTSYAVFCLKKKTKYPG